MKILYGVQGTGQGHISRARAIAKELANYPHIEVTWLFSGRSQHRFNDMECFGDWEWRRGLTFASRDGTIHYGDTLRDTHALTFIRDVIGLRLAQYDLIISDYEPVTAWVGKLRGRDTIGIGHQYAFDGATPTAGANPLTRSIMKYFAPTTKSVGLHWFPYSKSICPPIIDLPPLQTETREHVLVYLPFENQTTVTEWLNSMPSTSFKQYSSVLEDSTAGNVMRYTADFWGFKYALATCKGVICNSGFELISEALQLGKPILTFPMRGQMEQSSNALALQKLGLAQVSDTLSTPALNQFIDTLAETPSVNYPNVAQALAHWIAQGATAPIEPLSEHLWSAVRQPQGLPDAPPLLSAVA